jgi:Abnormal spindle-like microcephaly-assoc'd, ASPM-SPD-2-Hydin
MLCVLLVLNTNAASVVGLTPAKLDFGLLPVGTASQPRTATLTNTSNSALSVRDISASGIDFSETNTCPLSLPAGESCAIDVTFKPAIDGPRIGTIIISTSDPTSPQLLVLTGTGR